jgi:hypothetical protein
MLPPRPGSAGSSEALVPTPRKITVLLTWAIREALSMISRHGSEDILLILDPIIHIYNTFRAQKSSNFRMAMRDLHCIEVKEELNKRGHTVYTGLGLTRLCKFYHTTGFVIQDQTLIL